MELQPNQFWSLSEWLFDNDGLLRGGLLAVGLSVLGFLLSYLISVVRVGPVEGFYVVCRVIGQFFTVDLPGTSIRRILAIAKLAVKEAIRRRVIAIVGIFVVALMFAGWFLDPGAESRARMYIVFVLSGTNYLILLLGLFLSTFSLPEEIKTKTIYSIVTKPVRPTEIFLGRVVGFGFVGTVLLGLLAILSFVFVDRGLSHVHDVVEINADGSAGSLSKVSNHDHDFEIGEDGIGITSTDRGHYHTVTQLPGGKYEIGQPIGELQARVPLYGMLRFTDDAGQPGGGVSVGYENAYRKYIAGGTLASGIWEFDGVTEEAFPDGLNLEMELYAFRTYKGDIVTGVRGAIILRNPKGTAESERFPFIVNEGRLDQKPFATKMRGLKDGEPAEIDLFKDLAPEGKLEVVIRCLDQGQYFGMAAADVTIRKSDAPFEWNFFKGYVGIWLQLMIVICFGVMFSTFLSGPVALVATMAVIVLGFFGGMFADIIGDLQEGGGPIETLIRIVTQQGVITSLDLGNDQLENLIQQFDWYFMKGMSVVVSALPDFREFSTSEFVAYGVDIFGGLLSRHILIAFGYFLMTTLVGYFFLKTREMAA